MSRLAALRPRLAHLLLALWDSADDRHPNLHSQ